MKTSTGEGPAIVYGASGHGKVVADILRACSVEVEGFVDDDPSRQCTQVAGLKVLGNGAWLVERAHRQPVSAVLGIGDNLARRAVAEGCTRAGIRLLTAVHPSATIAPSATISSGVVIMAHAVVNADAVIREGAIINTGAIVEHDCVVWDFAHLSPKVAIGGRVSIGELSWLGIGSTVVPDLRVGTGSIVGAGATVVRDVDDWVVAVGTPARVLKELVRRF